MSFGLPKKRVRPNRHVSAFENNPLQVAAHVRFPPDGLKAFGKTNNDQRGAVGKGALADFRQALVQVDQLQGGAPAKRPFADFCRLRRLTEKRPGMHRRAAC